MEAFLGMICLFPQNRGIYGWAKCNGQLLQIAQNQALYAIIGTEFGGDGRTTFAVPNIPPLKPTNGGDVDYYICLSGVWPSAD